MIRAPLVDGLQYANWSEGIFRQMRQGGLDAVHVTLTYHENFRETVLNIERWNRWFKRFPELILHGRGAQDIRLAQETGRTAIFLGAQNPSCIEDDIRLTEIPHTLGLRFMQLSYNNNQSLLASGCYEAEDTGLTRMGREVVAEMNRVGLAVDMSHSGGRSTLEATEHSNRPIAITHANAKGWHPALRNKPTMCCGRLVGRAGCWGSRPIRIICATSAPAHCRISAWITAKAAPRRRAFRHQWPGTATIATSRALPSRSPTSSHPRPTSPGQAPIRNRLPPSAWRKPICTGASWPGRSWGR